MARSKRASTSKAVAQPADDDVAELDMDMDDQEQGVDGRVTSDAEDDEDFAASDDEQESRVVKAAPKSRKTTRKAQDPKKARRSSTTTKAKGKGRGRQGRLANFQEIPLDVLCEIAGHLDPLTLLHMSRVSKSFRALFLSKGAKSIWIQARKTVCLPDLQAEDVSEARYAAFVFEKKCIFCGKRASLMDPYIRARWCKACKKVNLISDSHLRGPQWHSSLTACMPWSLWSVSGQNSSDRHYYYKPDVVDVNRKLLDLTAVVEAESKIGKGKKKAVVQDDEDSEDPHVALQNYIDARKEIVINARVDGLAIEKWSRSSASERRSSEDALKTQRRAAVVQKLLALGYEQRDVRQLWGCTHLIDQPRALTDAIWNRIGPQIIAEVDRNIKHRIANEVATRQYQRSQLVKPLYLDMHNALESPLQKALFPSVEAFTQLKSVEQHWKDEQHDHADFQIDQAAWLASLDDILADVAAWQRHQQRKKFSDVARQLLAAEAPIANRKELLAKAETPWNHETKSHTPSTITEEEMAPVLKHTLAKAFFCGAGGCGGAPQAWPEIKEHEVSAHQGQHYLHAFVSSHWIKMMREIVKHAGLDAATFIYDDLEQLGPVFMCPCPDELPRSHYWGGAPPAPPAPVKKSELRWSEAVAHAASKHRGGYRYGDDRCGFGGKTPLLRIMGTPELVEVPKAYDSEAELRDLLEQYHNDRSDSDSDMY